MRANYTKDNLSKFIGDLRTGKSTVYNLPEPIPKLKKKKKQMKTDELWVNNYWLYYSNKIDYFKHFNKGL